jgi:hypothetical protein
LPVLPRAPVRRFVPLRFVAVRFGALRLVVPRFGALRLVVPRFGALRLVVPRFDALRLVVPRFDALRFVDRPAAPLFADLVFVGFFLAVVFFLSCDSAFLRAVSRSTSTPPFLLAGNLRQLPCSFGRLPGTGV